MVSTNSDIICGTIQNIIDGIINDKAAALYGGFYAIGAIFAPLLGSQVYAMLSNDWWYTCDVFACISTLYAVIFFVFNVMPDLHKEKQQRHEMAERLMTSENFHRQLININVIDEDDAEDLKTVDVKDDMRQTALFGIPEPSKVFNEKEEIASAGGFGDLQTLKTPTTPKEGLLTVDYAYQKPE